VAAHGWARGLAGAPSPSPSPRGPQAWAQGGICSHGGEAEGTASPHLTRAPGLVSSGLAAAQPRLSLCLARLARTHAV